jgi:hypothetical protein
LAKKACLLPKFGRAPQPGALERNRQGQAGLYGVEATARERNPSPAERKALRLDNQERQGAPEKPHWQGAALEHQSLG